MRTPGQTSELRARVHMAGPLPAAIGLAAVVGGHRTAWCRLPQPHGSPASVPREHQAKWSQRLGVRIACLWGAVADGGAARSDTQRWPSVGTYVAQGLDWSHYRAQGGQTEGKSGLGAKP